MTTTQPVYHVDESTSKRRAHQLQAYLTKNVWDPATLGCWENFGCCFADECYDSAARRGANLFEAQGHAVGPCYDLSTSDGTPHRVLVVPMEAGGGGGYFDVAGRTECVHHSGLLPFKERNAHMKGVTLALQLAFGIPVGESEHLLFDTGRSAHIFDSFAMANLLLCSAAPHENSQKSMSTATMRRSCANHLAETVRRLEPTLVISQGWGLVDTLWETLGVTCQIEVDIPKCYHTYCQLDGHPFVWVALYHPTRFWSSRNHTYFKETAAPAIKEARRRALRVARAN